MSYRTQADVEPEPEPPKEETLLVKRLKLSAFLTAAWLVFGFGFYEAERLITGLAWNWPAFCGGMLALFLVVQGILLFVSMVQRYG